jgi:hypothetical protein
LFGSFRCFMPFAPPFFVASSVTSIVFVRFLLLCCLSCRK